MDEGESEPTTDWSVIATICDQRGWLLEELPKTRLSFDEVAHTKNCNLHPDYQQGKTSQEIAQLIIRGCDCGAIARAVQERKLRWPKP